MHTQSDMDIRRCTLMLPPRGGDVSEECLSPENCCAKTFRLFPMQKVLNINSDSGHLRARLFFSYNQLYNSLTSCEA